MAADVAVAQMRAAAAAAATAVGLLPRSSSSSHSSGRILFLFSNDSYSLWGCPFPSYRAQDGSRGERAHLRPTTRKPNIIIKRIKGPQKRGDGDKRGPTKTRVDR